MRLDSDFSPEPMGDSEGGSGSSDGMSETTREEQGALSQIGSSFKNMLIGLLCFAVSFPVLYCGASRVHWSKVFGKAVPVEQAKDGNNPVYLTGTPAAMPIGDGNLLAADTYLRINKSIEAYAYIEHKDSKTKESREGTKKVKETTTTYSYSLGWTSDPRPISQFTQDKWNKYRQQNRIPANLQNPVITDAEKKDSVINTPQCTVGKYAIDVKQVSFAGGSKDLDKIYLRGNKDAPRLGDKRVSYSVYPSNIEYTFAGAVSGGKILPFYESDSDSNLPAAPGDFKALISALKSQDRLAGLLWFAGGFILMAAGLIMLAGPITTLLEFIPVLGGLGSGMIKFVLGLVALIISAIFWWVVKLWWLVLLILIGLGVFLYFNKKKKAASAA